MKLTELKIETLSSKIHDLYMAEVARQGQTRQNPIKYEDLDENTKEFDRVIARFILQRDSEIVGRLEKLKPEEKNTEWRQGVDDALYQAIKVIVKGEGK